ncbi:hypothetical protein ACFP2T_35035 [Plantactinospora solaniradicis]|uniref:Uncharacterized protein n=1 Tax=Plantactinospora solaniradicis TaxID=1723736 RepID=A0ABW1KI17_9ACTN
MRSDAGARLDRTYADVRFGGDFEPVTASTPKQREILRAPSLEALDVRR